MKLTRRGFSLMPAAAWAAPSSQRLRVAASPHLAMSPLHLAIEKGYFSDQGLELEIIPLTRSTDAIPVLAKGGLDVALYAVNPPLMNAIAKGVRIRLTAARDQALPDCGDTGSIYARRPISSVAELKGKKVANGHPAGIVEFALDSALQRAGVPRSSIEVILLRPAEAVAALMRGEVDALTGPDLSSMKALQTSSVTLLTTLGKSHPGFQHAFISYGRNLLDGPVDVGARFLRAYFRGVREFAAGATPAFMTDFAVQTGRDPKSVSALCRTHVIPDGRIHRPSLELFAKWAFARGFCEKPVSAASLIDERFLHAAQKG